MVIVVPCLWCSSFTFSSYYVFTPKFLNCNISGMHGYYWWCSNFLWQMSPFLDTCVEFYLDLHVWYHSLQNSQLAFSMHCSTSYHATWRMNILTGLLLIFRYFWAFQLFNSWNLFLFGHWILLLACKFLRRNGFDSYMHTFA